MEKGGGQRVFFKCKYCKVFFDTAVTLVAHKRFEHADQIFGKSPNNNKTDWDPLRSSVKKSPTKIRVNPLSSFAAKNKLREERPGLSTKVFKMPGIPRNRNSDENTRLKCRFCPLTLASAEKLRHHERIHTGEKPYQCQHCLKGFTEESAAESHEKKCPVLDILKSEVKEEEKKCSNIPKMPLKNGFKTKKLAQSGSSASKNNSYLQKRLSYTRNFPFPNCNKNFKESSGLPRHMKTQERNTVDCFPILKTEKLPFLPHILKCTGSQGQVNYSCQKCNKRLATRASCFVHSRAHFGPKIFTCPVCDKTFSALKEIVAHFCSHPTNITSSLESAPEISTYISCYFRETSGPTRHEDTDNHYTEQEDAADHNRNVFKCKLCRFKIFSKPGVPRVAGYRHQMRLHIRRKHTQTNLYKCDHCHRGYPQICELKRHTLSCRPRKTVTVKVENLKCPVCAIGFDSNESLVVHSNGHSKMPFLCIKCGLWFRRAQDIKGHLVDCAK